MRKNKYLIISGADGCGKGTQSRLLVEHLKKNNQDVIYTREPGSPLIKDYFNVRDFVLSHKKVNPKALELLFQADRAEHTAKVKEYLDAGYWVVSDRSYVCGLAYAMACGHSFDEMVPIVKFAVSVYPDHVFMLSVDPEVARKRLSTNTREEAKGIEFAAKVQDNMRWVLQEQHDMPHVRFNIFDTTETDIQETHEKIMKAIPIPS